MIQKHSFFLKNTHITFVKFDDISRKLRAFNEEVCTRLLLSSEPFSFFLQVIVYFVYCYHLCATQNRNGIECNSIVSIVVIVCCLEQFVCFALDCAQDYESHGIWSLPVHLFCSVLFLFWWWNGLKNWHRWWKWDSGILQVIFFFKINTKKSTKFQCYFNGTKKKIKHCFLDRMFVWPHK